jgi:hypothetical protein
MPGATPTYALPYPIGTDRLDAAVTTIPQSLALAVESTIAALGGVAAPGSWQTPSLSAGVANLGSGFALGRYRKVLNTVKLRGTLSFASGAPVGYTLFTLPVGFRPSVTSPAGHVLYPVAASIGYARIDVLSTGAVTLQSAIASGGFVALDSIEFDVD